MVVLDIKDANLLLVPAERADIIIDFSQYEPGSIIILYNDAPAANPAFDVRYDYFTGCTDQIAAGGAPTTLPGYGSNTRTIMQFRVVARPGGPSPPLDVANLTTEIGKAYVASQDPPLIPQSDYASLYGGVLGDPSLYVDNKVYVEDNFLTFKNINVSATAVADVVDGKVIAAIMTNGGSDYIPQTTTVRIDPPPSGQGVQATATPLFGTGTLQSVTVTNPGSGYHLVPATVNGITGANNAPVTLQTTANVNLSNGSISSINLPAPVYIYNTLPTVTIAAPIDKVNGVQATAIVVLGANRRISGFTITKSGSGYLPLLSLDGAYGSEAQASAILSYDPATKKNAVVGVSNNKLTNKTNK